MIPLSNNPRGFEAYAKEHHHFPPAFTAWVNGFLAKSPWSLSAMNEAKILILKGIIAIKGHYPLDPAYRRQLWDLALSDDKAKRLLERIPPRLRFNLVLEKDLYLRACNWAWIWITPWKSLPSGRAKGSGVTNVQVGGKEVKNITSTPCFMFCHIQVWAKGVLNFPGEHCGNSFNLATAEGMALLLHELFHIYQFRRNPFRMLWWYIRALRDSLVYDHILFSHPRIFFEVEAMAFEYEARSRLLLPSFSQKLREYEKMR